MVPNLSKSETNISVAAHGAYYTDYLSLWMTVKSRNNIIVSRKRVDLTFEIEECRSLIHVFNFMITINLRDIAKFSVYSPLHL